MRRKTSLEKSHATRPKPSAQTANMPFFRKASAGDFFPPAIQALAQRQDLAAITQARRDARLQKSRRRTPSGEPEAVPLPGQPEPRVPPGESVAGPVPVKGTQSTFQKTKSQSIPLPTPSLSVPASPTGTRLSPGTGPTRPGPATSKVPPGAAMVRAPRSPHDDREFQMVQGDVRRSGRQQKNHEETGKKVKETEDASALDAASQMRQDGIVKRTAEIETTGKHQNKIYHFDSGKFKEQLLKRIKSVLPNDEDQANEFPTSNKLQGVKDDVTGSVANEKQAAVGRLDELISTDPPAGVAEKPVKVIIPPAKPAAPAPHVKPGLAVPKPKTEQEISLQHESDKLDGLMTENNLTRDQLADSNEPKFVHALKFKEETQQRVAEAPGKYRQQEQPVLSAAQLEAGKLLQLGLGGMRGRKTGATGRVFKQQSATESKTETRQKEIKATIEGNYKETIDEVTQILKTLTESVRDGFSKTLERLTGIFNDEVTDRLKEYYGDWRIDDELFGPVSIIKDPETGEIKFINPDVYAIFVEEKDWYLKVVGRVLDRTAQAVADGLNKAYLRVQKGRKDQDDFKKTLKDDELAYANTLTEQVNLQFAAMETSIEDTQEELLTSLSEQYTENVKQLEKSFNEINDELKKSWLDRAAEFLKTVAVTIYELADLLLSILTRIANIVWDIIKHPIKFFETLVRGLLRGIGDFIEGIGTHLEEAFWSWITGASAAKGITLGPGSGVEKLFGVVVQVLSISREDLHKLAERIFGKETVALVERGLAAGEKLVAGAEKLLEPAVILMRDGAGALWTYIKDSLTGLVESAFTRIKETVFSEFVIRGLKWIAGFFVPGGGFVKVVKALFAAVQFLVENMENIRAIFDSVLGSFEQAVRGDASGVAEHILQGLKRGVVLALDFLARQLGLDKILEKVRKFFHDLRKPLLQALEWILRQVKTGLEKIGFFALLKKAGAAVRKGKEAVAARVEAVKEKAAAVKERILNWWNARKTITTATGEDHTLYYAGPPEHAELMIQSTAQKYSTFVKKLPIDKNNDKQKLADLALEIDRRLDRYPLVPQEERKAWGVDLVKLLNQAAALTRKYAFKQEGTPNTVITWDPPNKEGFGVGFKAMLLSKNYVKGEPARVEQKAVYGWDIVRSRKAISAKGKETHVYVKGHLLNENMGGKANLTNLTPITITANNEHKTKVENIVKGIVLTKSRAAGEGVANYQVKAVYDGHPHRAALEGRFEKRVALIDKELAKLEKTAVPRKEARVAGLTDERNDLLELVLLLDYEENELATSLLCKWQKMTWDVASEKWIADPAEGEQTEPIKNKLPEDIGGYNFIIRQYLPESL